MHIILNTNFAFCLPQQIVSSTLQEHWFPDKAYESPPNTNYKYVISQIREHILYTLQSHEEKRAEHEPAVCPGGQEGQWHPSLCCLSRTVHPEGVGKSFSLCTQHR